MRAEELRIPTVHPAFAGHFPRRALLPGSMLLEMILAAWGEPVARVPAVKFHRPVLPGDVLTLVFTPLPEGRAVRFGCTRGQETVCSGVLLPAQVPC